MKRCRRQTTHRGDGDNGAPAALVHELTTGSTPQVEELPHYRIEAVVPVVVGEIDDLTPSDLTDHVDHDVEAPEFRNGLRHDPFCIRR